MKKKFFKKAPVKKVVFQKKEKNSPSIHRFITESTKRFFSFPGVRLSFYKDGRIWIFTWFTCFSIGLLIAIIFTGNYLYRGIKQEDMLKRERLALVKEQAYWEDIARKYPGYRDAYFQLAVVTYELGEYEKSRKYLREVLLLDPNFSQGRELEELLKKR